MTEYSRKLKFINSYKLYFPLAYNPEIDMEPSVCELDSHLTGFTNTLKLATFLNEKKTKISLRKLNSILPVVRSIYLYYILILNPV